MMKMNENHMTKIDEVLITIVAEKKPTSLDTLVQLAKMKMPSLTEVQIIENFSKLEKKGILKLEKKSQPSQSLLDYLKGGESVWYWVTIFVATLTMIITFIDSGNSYFLSCLRLIFGVIFILFLPGFVFIKLFFSENKSNFIMQLVLSIGLSLAIVPTLGLMLYYFQNSLPDDVITLNIFLFVVIFGSVAVLLRYWRANKLHI